MVENVVEILTAKRSSPTAAPMLIAMRQAIEASGLQVYESQRYRGAGKWLVLFGAGAAPHNEARNRHVEKGGRALLFDLGYFGRQKVTGFLRMSIDDDHCQRWLDATPAEPNRWAAHGIGLREDADPRGPIILVGLGRKSRSYLNAPTWEQDKLLELQHRFPGRRIVYRPKGKEFEPLSCEADTDRPIAEVLKGASLVVCRHSNVAVDAAVAGVPFEAVDGAAMWLLRREFTPANRLEFLQRLAWWQWRSTEARQAWAHVRRVVGG